MKARLPTQIDFGSRSTWRTVLSNLPIGIISVVLAALLWVAVTNEENPTLRQEVPFQVPVSEINIPNAYVVGSASPDHVSVTLTGAQDRVHSVKPEDLLVRVDLAGALTGGAPNQSLHYTVPAQVSVRKRGVQAEVNPESIAVTLEPEVQRTVPIKVNTLDTLPPGFDMAETPSTQPSEATISGAKENVDLVSAAIADVKLDGLTVNIEKTFPLDPRDSNGHPIGHVSIEPNQASVSVKVKQVQFTRQLTIDPHVRGRPAPGYGVGTIDAQPATLNVSGSLDAINQLSTVPTQDVDVEGATSDVVRTVGVQLPPGLTTADSKSSIVVRVAIQALAGPGSIGVAPKIVGVGQGLSAALQTPTVVVNLTGSLPFLLKLAPGDVIATVDASGLGPGTYRLEPKIGLPAGIQADTVLPDRVAITISNASAPR
jgi:YbbR domain-containing protein